jgi:hypothetical protein
VHFNRRTEQETIEHSHAPAEPHYKHHDPELELIHTHPNGWGWGKAMQKHIPHKKKKGKKGALAKIFNKFRPKSKKRQPLVWKEERECDGWDNFLKGRNLTGNQC